LLRENGNRRWRALSHRIFRRRPATGNRKDKLEIGCALAYTTTQLLSSLQLFDQEAGAFSRARTPGKPSN